MQDLGFLASPALGGRATGTPDAVKAAHFIGQRYLALGLQPVFPTPCGPAPRCESAYLQRFVVPPGPFPGSGGFAMNVAAILPGADPSVSHEFVVIGAHYDHLGTSPIGSRDPRFPGVRLGADDNASGTAAILELARRFAERPPRRSILFVAFGAEELGLVGSRAFVDEPPVSLDSITAMINLDMVGRLQGKPLIVYGTHSSSVLRTLVDSAGSITGQRLRPLGPGEGRSDHASFRRHDVPALHFHTGEHLDYHTARDRTERIDGPGLMRVIDVVEATTRLLADHAGRLPRD